MGDASKLSPWSTCFSKVGKFSTLLEPSSNAAKIREGSPCVDGRPRGGDCIDKAEQWEFRRKRITGKWVSRGFINEIEEREVETAARRHLALACCTIRRLLFFKSW